jgi:hypothetical protein
MDYVTWKERAVVLTADQLIAIKIHTPHRHTEKLKQMANVTAFLNVTISPPWVPRHSCCVSVSGFWPLSQSFLSYHPPSRLFVLFK